jgi:hypothetical protein
VFETKSYKVATSDIITISKPKDQTHRPCAQTQVQKISSWGAHFQTTFLQILEALSLLEKI